MAVVLMHGGDNCSDGDSDDGNSGDSNILKLIAMVMMMIMLPNFNKNSLKRFYL
jgi:hypothetical protein